MTIKQFRFETKLKQAQDFKKKQNLIEKQAFMKESLY